MPDKLIQEIRKYKWKSTTADKIIGLIKTGITINTIPAFKTQINVADSKFGGAPDLPDHFKWPYKGDIPLSFVAQLNLEELKAYDMENLFPSNGMLYFFYLVDLDNLCCVSERDEFKVLYYPGPVQNLKRAILPESLTEDQQIDECKIDYSKLYTLPSRYENPEIEALNLSGKDKMNLQMIEHFLYSNSVDEGERHQVAGEPQSIQSDVRYIWALNSLNIEDPEQDENNEAEKLQNDFVLLLQINPLDKNSNLTNLCFDWVIYYGIRKQDLINRNFENVYLTGQGT